MNGFYVKVCGKDICVWIKKKIIRNERKVCELYNRYNL